MHDTTSVSLMQHRTGSNLLTLSVMSLLLRLFFIKIIIKEDEREKLQM